MIHKRPRDRQYGDINPDPPATAQLQHAIIWKPYGLVPFFGYKPNTICSSLTSWFSNSLPWSECNTSGTPYAENTRSSRVRAMVVASLFEIAASKIKRIKWSITEKAYLRPCETVWHCTRSIATRQNGQSTGTWPVSVGRWCGAFRRWQALQLVQQDWISLCIVGHRYRSWTLSNVTLNAKWPPDAGRSWHAWIMSERNADSTTNWSWQEIRFLKWPGRYDRYRTPSTTKKLLADWNVSLRARGEWSGWSQNSSTAQI